MKRPLDLVFQNRQIERMHKSKVEMFTPDGVGYYSLKCIGCLPIPGIRKRSNLLTFFLFILDYKILMK